MFRAVRSTVIALAAIVGLATTAAPAAAQSDILLQLRSGSPAGDRFRVDSAGGFVALGQITIGIIPASGQGYRMMWYPGKVAFRAGYADAGGQFDESNIGYFSWAGGNLSTAAGIYSFAMGNQNTIEASAQCAMAIGSGNFVAGSGGEIGTCGVALGLGNDVRDHVGVAIGQNNNAAGDNAVAIGFTNTADANYSVALGYRASTNGFQGAMVLNDASNTDSTLASATNQFTARYAGGYRLYTNANRTTGVTMAAGGSSWVVVSDRDRKHDFLGIDGEDLLDRLEDVPVSSWRYREEADQSTRHIGPMAQDWNAAFGLSSDPLTINMSDFDGVNLAAIQALRVRTDGLRADVAARDERIAALEDRVGELAAQNAALEARLRRIEEALGSAE